MTVCNRLLLIVATACVALAVAACGGSARSSSHALAAVSAGVRYAECMRVHGVPNFADAGAGDAPIDFRSPAFLGAVKACAGLQPLVGSPRPISASARAQLVAITRCMRAHGVPNMPDPRFTGNVVYLGAAGVDRDAPAFTRAATICHYPFPRLP
jgi:hypothetical protein